jgi:TRAP-type C4-dicarboxylate transport system permease small subunit
MSKRLLLSLLFALVVCGVSFYLAYFVGLIYLTASGPLNPANAPGFQAALRHVALPVSIGLGAAVFVLALWRLGKRPSGKASPNETAIG